MKRSNSRHRAVLRQMGLRLDSAVIALLRGRVRLCWRLGAMSESVPATLIAKSTTFVLIYIKSETHFDVPKLQLYLPAFLIVTDDISDRIP